jgi:hypothetical protein
MIDNKKVIVLSAWSKPLRNGKVNAKNYPHWQELVNILKTDGWYIIQIGQGAEVKLRNVDESVWDKDIWHLKEEIDKADLLLGIDNFFPHLWEYYGKSGIVLWSASDPTIFGYRANTNVLKDVKFLRPQQFAIWEEWEANLDAWLSANEVFQIIKNYKINK